MTVKDYMVLPYNIIFRRTNDESGAYYFATVQELEGCMSDGVTIEEAFANIQEAMEGWIETKLEAGYPVPQPSDNKIFNGRFTVNLPKSLYARLAEEAEKEGVSLDRYALYKLSS